MSLSTFKTLQVSGSHYQVLGAQTHLWACWWIPELGGVGEKEGQHMEELQAQVWASQHGLHGTQLRKCCIVQNPAQEHTQCKSPVI